MICPGTFHAGGGTMIDRCGGGGVRPWGSACSGWYVGDDWGGGPTHSALETPFDGAQDMLRLGSRRGGSSTGRAECPASGNGPRGNGEWVGGACRWPGGRVPLGEDGVYEGWCDSWDSFSSAPPKADFQLGGCSTYSLIRADVGCQAWEVI